MVNSLLDTVPLNSVATSLQDTHVPAWMESVREVPKRMEDIASNVRLMGSDFLDGCAM